MQCNFRCRHCFIPDDWRPRHDLDPQREWPALDGALRQHDVLHVHLLGGEPLLHPSFEDIYRAVADAGYFVSVTSNLSLLRESHVRLFAQWPLLRMRVTLLGVSDAAYVRCGAPGVAGRVIGGVQRLLSAGVRVEAVLPMQSGNRGEADGVARFCRGTGIPLRVITQYFPRLDGSCQTTACQLLPSDAEADVTKLRARYGMVTALATEQNSCTAGDLSWSYVPGSGLIPCALAAQCPHSARG
jgi:molybdenum cofactor biosynthesis enzyme MoaA